MQINGEKGGEIGVERGKRMTVEVLLCFESLFQWNGIPDWLAACHSVNNKNISVPKGSNFHSRSNFHSTYLTMKSQFQLVCRSITLALRGSFAYSLFSSLSLRNPQFSNILLMSQTKQQWTDNRKQAVCLQEKARETVSIIKKEGVGNNSN